MLTKDNFGGGGRWELANDLSRKEYYKMKMILIVSNWVEWSNKAWRKPGTLTGVYVNSVYVPMDSEKVISLF